MSTQAELRTDRLLQLIPFGAVALAVLALMFSAFGGSSKSSIASIAQAQQIAFDLSGQQMEQPVVMFVTASCPACRAAEKYFTKKEIDFVKANVGQDRKAYEYLRKLSSSRGVPHTIIGRELILGYNPTKINRALRKMREELQGSGPGI